MKFEGDLSKLKDLNIKIKEILYFYNYLVGNNDEGFEEKVTAYIREKKEAAKEESEESEESEDSEDSEDCNESIIIKNPIKNVKNKVKVHIDDDEDQRKEYINIRNLSLI